LVSSSAVAEWNWRGNVTATDEAAAIVAELRESWARSDVVITTGGLGPTCDDRTREAAWRR